jgi:hypothetical protein
MLSRRHLLSATALIPAAALVACDGSSAATVDTQIVADASGIVNGLIATANQINAVAPGKIPASITADLLIAQGLVTGIAPTVTAPAAATTLQTVDNYISGALTTIADVLPVAAAAFPVLAAAIPIVDAVIALLPVVEAWVNPLIGQLTASAAAPVHPIAATMAPADARKVLGVALVK